MNAIMPKGWCPSLLEPMASGDGLLVRVRPPRAVLTAEAARQLGAAAARFGNGAIELTNRAAIQVRGLTAASVAPFAAAMIAAGLADADVERRRAIVASPLIGDDPGASRHARAVASTIEARASRDARLAKLPPKFVVAVDGGGVLPLGDIGADIRVVCDDAECLVTIAGARFGAAAAPASVPDMVDRLALAFLRLAARCSPAPQRMRALVLAVGTPALFAAAGMEASRPLPNVRTRSVIGFLPYAEGDRGAFGVGLPFGGLTAATLASLADLVERFGDGTLRGTPWRTFAIPGIAAKAAAGLCEAAARLGMIVDPRDPRRSVIACPGRPSCASASVETRADAELLVSLALPELVHVSGCAKGCAHPAPARFTLVGDGGRYAIIRDGRPGDAPVHRNLTIEQAVAVLRSLHPSRAGGGG